MVEQLASSVSSHNNREQPETQEDQNATIDSRLAQLETTSDCEWLKTEIQVRSDSTELEKSIREKTATAELLSWTKTEKRLLDIVKSDEFSSLWETPKERLDIIFKRVNMTITSYIERQFNFSKEQMDACPVLKQSLIPAIEWYLLDALKGEKDSNWDSGGNAANNGALDIFNKTETKDLSWILKWIFDFAWSSQYLYRKVKTLQRAIDYLAIHKDILGHWECYEELANPYKCLEYLSNPIWAEKRTDNLFDETLKPVTVWLHLKDKSLSIWMTKQEKKDLHNKLWHIQVVKNSKTTKNILTALWKADEFIKTTGQLKLTAMTSLSAINEPLEIFSGFWLDVTKRVSDSPFLKWIADFFCSAIGFPGWFEGFKREREHQNGTYHTDETLDNTEGWGGTENDENENMLASSEILEQSKKNLENLIKFQKQFLSDYWGELSAKEKKKFDRLIEDSEELQNNDSFSLARFQKEMEELTKQTKNLTKKYLTDSDDIAPLKEIFDENKAIRKKMKDLREQQEKNKKEQEESDSHSSDSWTPDISDADSNAPTQNEPDHYNREQVLSWNNLEPYHEWWKILFDDLIAKNMPGEQEAFKKQLLKVAASLEVNPNWLMLLFFHESGVNPHVPARSWASARGLFQLLARYAPDGFAEKSGVEQLKVFQDIYKQFKGRIKNYNDLSLMCFAPSCFWKSVIYDTPDKVNPNKPYDKNNDGKITMEEFNQHHDDYVRKHVPQDMRNQFLTGTGVIA